MIDPRIAKGVKLVPELQAELNDLVNMQGTSTPTENLMFEQQLQREGPRLETIIAALTAAGEMAHELAEAREALKPFAKLAGYCAELTDDTPSHTKVTAGDLRRAARAYANKDIQ